MIPTKALKKYLPSEFKRVLTSQAQPTPSESNCYAGIKAVSYARPQDFLKYKNFYIVNKAKTNLYNVPLYTKDQVDYILQSQLSKPHLTPSQSDDERAKFEKSFSNHYLGKFTNTANYINSGIDGAWTGWQARAQLSKPHPTSQDKTDNTQVILDLQEQLEETIKQRNYWQDMAGNYANDEHEAKEQLANAELTIQTMSKATHPTPSQSEPVAKYKKEDSTFQLPLWLTHQEKYSKELGRGYSPLFAVPQPTSQDVLDAKRYRWLRIAKNLQINLITYCFWEELDNEIDAAMKESK